MNHGYGGNIWAYDSNGDQWREHESTSIPPRRYWGDVAYDSNRIVMFGGHGATEFDDTWAFDIDMGDWEQASGDTRPARGSAPTWLMIQSMMSSSCSAGLIKLDQASVTPG